jgi:isoleucyl-tRNA synthetase
MVLRYVGEWRQVVTRMGRWVDFDDDYAEKLFGPGPATYALAWTTTPWTLPGNLALCVGPEIEYRLVEDEASGARYVAATERLSALYKSESEYRVVRSFPGKELVGLTYEPLFPYFASQPGAFRILSDGFVSTGDGTGIVHIAPAYGEDDYRVCRRDGIELVDPLDAECKFTNAVPEHQGILCKDADKAIACAWCGRASIPRSRRPSSVTPPSCATRCWRSTSRAIPRRTRRRR